MKSFIRRCRQITLTFLMSLLLVGQANATEYKCYVTGTDTLHYIVIVDFTSVGMAATAARHVQIDTPNMGRVGVQDVQECAELDKSFRSKAARQLDERTPRETITNSRK